MKIILIDQNNNEDTIQEMATPLGLCYLAAYAQKYVDPALELRMIDGKRDRLEEEADLVGISSMSRYFHLAAPLARRIKEEKGIPVVFGGPHVSAIPESLPSWADVAVLGEGEETFAEILRLFKEKGALRPADLTGIVGIAFRDGDSFVRTAPRFPIETLDTIPMPRRDLWPMMGRVK